MLPLHGAEVAALFCSMASRAFLDIHAHQYGQVQPETFSTVYFKNGRDHNVDYN